MPGTTCLAFSFFDNEWKSQKYTLSFNHPYMKFVVYWFQGETPKQRAEKANDKELADYLETCQHYQMIQREDQETEV